VFTIIVNAVNSDLVNLFPGLTAEVVVHTDYPTQCQMTVTFALTVHQTDAVDRTQWLTLQYVNKSSPMFVTLGTYWGGVVTATPSYPGMIVNTYGFVAEGTWFSLLGFVMVTFEAELFFRR